MSIVGEVIRPAPINILVVDDEADIREYLQDFLEAEGYQVDASGDPNDALMKIRDDAYQLLILDLMMPKKSGLEVLTSVRQIDTEIAVIVLTGYPSLETARSSIALDIEAYIQKPFVAAELRDAVGKVARKKGLLQNREDQMHADIGRRLRELRKKRGLTLRQIAKRTNLSISLISQLERSNSPASVSSLYKVATALDVTMTTLFDGY